MTFSGIIGNIMTAELLPPPEFDHTLTDNLSHDQLVGMWLDVLEASDEMLLAGLRARLPAGADLQAAYRDWYEQYCREHFDMLERMAERFNQAQAKHDKIRSAENS